MIPPTAARVPEHNCLDHLVSPWSSDDFLRTIWARQFLHISGHKDKFRKLYSWDQLNRTLENYPLEPPRIRLSKGGQDIDPQRYLAPINVPSRGKIHHLRLTELRRELQQGATLVLSHIENLSPELKQLSAALERLFRVYVNINLYAAFGTDEGFGLHWDNQDSLVLQLGGRKRWRVYEPTRLYPMASDKSTPVPTGVAVWDGILDEGGLLHIPRGWWHIASPMSEPSFHLTVTINSVTGLDFLRWFVDGLTNCERVRENIPVWAWSAGEPGHLDLIRQELLRGWKPDLAERFVAHLDTSAIPYCKIGLPDTVAPDWPRIETNTHLAFSLTRPLVYSETDNGVITFRYGGKTWRFGKNLLPVLDLLGDGKMHRFDEISALAFSPEDRALIKDFVVRLVQAGLAIADSTNPSTL